MLGNFNKHICLVMLLGLGFFLMPVFSYACAKKSTKSAKTSCSKGQNKKSEQKECCKTKTCKKDKNCEHNSCSCSTSSWSFSLPAPSDLETKNHFAQTKKQKFDFDRAYYSSGFLTIWLPPKIS